jgi:hypothetical protein
MDLVGERLGQALVTDVDRGRDGGMLAQQIFDALGLDRGLVVHAARAYRPSPQGPAVWTSPLEVDTGAMRPWSMVAG